MKISVFGCGTMAAILLKQMKKFDRTLQVSTYNPSFFKASVLAEEVQGTAYPQIADMPKADYYFLSCKPQHIQKLAKDLSPSITRRSTVISILAGVSIQRLKDCLGEHFILRLMPNIANEISRGVNLFYNLPGENILKKKYILHLFSQFSEIVNLTDEKDLDRLTLISGSGPAYLFEIIRILQAWIDDYRIDNIDSKQVIIRTMQGALELLSEGDTTPLSLRDRVTSKGGVTEEVLNSFKKYDFEKILRSSLDLGMKKLEKL